MLVLTRKKNETIIIDGRITIEILDIRGQNIRIGMNAPADVKILRGELKPYGLAPDVTKSALGQTEVTSHLQIANVG